MYDRLEQNQDELSALARDCGIDWSRVGSLSFGRETRPPVIHNKYLGKSEYTVERKVSSSGSPYISIKFFTYKHGGVSRAWFSFDETTEEFKKRRQVEREQEREEKRRIRALKEAQQRKKLYLEYKELFKNAPRTVCSPYLDQKLITDIVHHADIRTASDNHGEFIAVPLENTRRQYVGLQRIYHSGKKKLTMSLHRGMYRGAHYVFGDPENSSVIYIAEGFATAASIFLGTGCAAVFSINAQNLKHVTAHFKSKYKGAAKIIIAADDDQGKNGNTGIFKALEAAKESKVKIVTPPSIGRSDWNDFWQESHIDEFKYEIEKNKENILRAEPRKLDYTLQLIEYAPRQQLPRLIKDASWDARVPFLISEEKFVEQLSKICGKKVSIDLVKKYVRAVVITGSLKSKDISEIPSHAVDKHIKMTTAMNSKGHFVISPDTVSTLKQSLDSRDLVILRSPMGTQKTEAAIKTGMSKTNRSALLLPRVSVVDDASKRLQLDHYREVDDITAHFTDQIVTCINSVGAHRFWTEEKNWFEDLDLLCIDEASQVLPQIVQLGSLTQKTQNYKAFQKAVQTAKSILVTDADANQFMLEQLKRIDPSRKVTLIDVEHPKDAHLFWDIHFTDQVKDVMTAIIESVKSGEKVLLATDNKKKAQQLQMFLELLNPKLRILNIHREPSEKSRGKIRAFYDSPNTECVNYDVLIYSPAITSGVSITTQHFTRHYGIFTGVIKVCDIIQMMGRDRTARKWHLAINSNRSFNAMSAADAEAALKEMGSEPTPFSKLKFATDVYESEARQNLIILALNILKNKGHKIHLAEGISTQIGERFHHLSKLISDYLVQKREKMILSQEEIPEARYRELKNSLLLSEEEAAALHAYTIRHILCDDLTKSSLEFYDRGGLKKISLYETIFASKRELAQFDSDEALRLDPSIRYFAQEKQSVFDKIVHLLGLKPGWEGEFTHRDCQKVLDYFIDNRARMNQVFGVLLIDSEPPRCATSFVKKILSTIGIELDKRKSHGNMVRSIDLKSVERLEKLYEARLSAGQNFISSRLQQAA